MSITSERFIVLVLSLLYVVAVFCFSSSALPAQPKRTSDGVSNGTNKIANFQASKEKYESSNFQASKKPAINQDNAKVGTSQKTRVQKISENSGENTTKKVYTQKLTGSKSTEKPTQQNGSSSNNSSSTNSSNKNRNSKAIGGNFSSSNKTNNMNTSNSTNKTSNMNSSNISGSNKTNNMNTSNSTNKTSNMNSSNISGSNTSSINSSNSSNKTNSMNSSNISGSNTSSSASIAEARNNSLRADNMDFDFSSDLNFTKEVIKRNSANKIFTVESGDSSKPIEIEVKTYSAPANTSAIIEVRPEKPITNGIDILNNPDQNSWPLYQYSYPQEINGPQVWYMQQYQPSLPPSLTHVPTEELLHSQSFSNTPIFGSQLLYQYPVKEAVYKRQSFSPRSRYVFSDLRNNQAKIPKPDPKDDRNLLPKHAVEPLARIFSHRFDTPPHIKFSLPQDYFPPYFLPHTNGIQNSFYTQDEHNLENKPAVTKYVTNSYVLKTHPKLEWVPL